MRAIVTGAAGGIGLAVARKLAAQHPDARLVLVDRDADRLKSAAEGLSAEVENVAVDLTSPDGPQRVADAATRRFGGADALVSNAGITHAYRLNDLPEAEFDRMFDINLKSAWRLAKACHPLLRDSKGALVATTSIVASHPIPGVGVYAVSKAALLMLVQQLALEWADDGIRCNTVSPGSILTPMTAGSFTDEVLAERGRAIPSGRVGQPEDIADLIAYLLTPGAAFINGANLKVDGGADIALMFKHRPAIIN